MPTTPPTHLLLLAFLASQSGRAIAFVLQPGYPISRPDAGDISKD